MDPARDLPERGRRWRRTPALRRFARETRLHPADLVAPLFVTAAGKAADRTPIAALPGHFRWGVDAVAEEAARLEGLGIGAVILFGIPAKKHPKGEAAWHEEGPVPQALDAVRTAAPGLVRIADVCLCEYTDHGHC